MKFHLGLAAVVLVVSIADAAEPTQASLMSQATLSRAAAEKIALAKVPSGTVKSAELEREKGALVWSFDISTPTSRDIHEILVNAKTGAIVDTSIETPAAQSREAAAEEHESSKH